MGATQPLNILPKLTFGLQSESEPDSLVSDLSLLIKELKRNIEETSRYRPLCFKPFSGEQPYTFYMTEERPLFEGGVGELIRRPFEAKAEGPTFFLSGAVFTLLPWLWKPKALTIQLQSSAYGEKDQPAFKALEAEWFPPARIDFEAGLLYQQDGSLFPKEKMEPLKKAVEALDIALGTDTDELILREDTV